MEINENPEPFLKLLNAYPVWDCSKMCQRTTGGRAGKLIADYRHMTIGWKVDRIRNTYVNVYR